VFGRIEIGSVSAANMTLSMQYKVEFKDLHSERKLQACRSYFTEAGRQIAPLHGLVNLLPQTTMIGWSTESHWQIDRTMQTLCETMMLEHQLQTPIMSGFWFLESEMTPPDELYQIMHQLVEPEQWQ
jgi:hypothetical protein